MGLETATYISGLTASWPLSGDLKSQGDDHIRLLKSTLQATFPSATKAFYFPKAEIITGTLTLDATDQNNLVIVDTTSGSIAVTLPTLGSGDTGWSCEVVKIAANSNAAIVSPASGSINSKVGSTATIRVGQLAEPAKFMWSGSYWLCSKPGPCIGSVESFDGSTIPYGYLDSAGASYNTTDYAELFAVLASSTLRDRRGRIDIGDGTGSGLTARVAGTTYGAETMQLAVTNLPAETPAGSISGGTYGVSYSLADAQTGSGAQRVNQIADGTSLAQDVTLNPLSNPNFTGTAFAGRNATAFDLLQPSIGTKRIIRAC